MIDKEKKYTVLEIQKYEEMTKELKKQAIKAAMTAYFCFAFAAYSMMKDVNLYNLVSDSPLKQVTLGLFVGLGMSSTGIAIGSISKKSELEKEKDYLFEQINKDIYENCYLENNKEKNNGKVLKL